jgi:hypothetical protein
MIWGKRVFNGAAFAPYQNRLQQLLLANAKQYQEFIMVATEGEQSGIATYWVGVPSEILFTAFDGFEHVQEADLPKEIGTLLVADATKQPFTSRFKFAHHH